MAIDPSKSSIFRAVTQIQIIPTNLFLIIRQVSFAILAAAVLLLAANEAARFLPGLIMLPSFFVADRYLLWAVINLSFAFWAPAFLLLAFIDHKLKRQGRKLGKKFDADDNLVEYLDFKAARIFKRTFTMDHLPFERLLFYLILSSSEIDFSLKRLNIDRTVLKKDLLDAMKDRSKMFSRDNSQLVNEMNKDARQQVMELACKFAVERGSDKATIFDLFLVLSDRDRDFQRLMDSLELLKEDVQSVFLWQRNLENYRIARKQFWGKDNLRLLLAYSPAKGLVGGFTVLLDRFSRDITLVNPLRHGGVVLHEAQIAQLEEALIKQKGNGVLLIGEPGSGRKSVIYNLANRIASESGPAVLRAMRVLELDMVSLVASFAEESVLVAAIETIFQEAQKAKNVILVIPNIDSHIGRPAGDKKLAAVDMSGVISQYLDSKGFRVIGITGTVGYRRSIEPTGISASFVKVEIASATAEETMRVLKEESLRRENKAGLFIPMASLKEIVKLCDYFLGDAVFPAKALNLLDDLVSNRLGGSGKIIKKILPADVDAYFSRKYDLPAGAAGAQEKDILLNLEGRIHEGLINQEEAVLEVANALRRARAQIKQQKRTIGNFLFLGPTGCGKTETAKQLAKVYFGSAKNMVRLDMAEYQTIDSVYKMIGDEQNPGFLSTALRENPFSLILVDEIEKSHPGILNVFLNIFDEGEMTDGFGRKVDFRHAIIIATSNAGAERIKVAVENGQSMSSLKNNLIDELLAQGIFKPEFINRFDGVVLYRPLNEQETVRVARLLLAEVQAGLRQRRIEFEITDQLAAELAHIGFDPVFGGRAMRRTIQDKIENLLAKAILAGTLKPGDKFTVDPETWEIVVAQ